MVFNMSLVLQNVHNKLLSGLKVASYLLYCDASWPPLSWISQGARHLAPLCHLRHRQERSRVQQCVTCHDPLALHQFTAAFITTHAEFVTVQLWQVKGILSLVSHSCKTTLCECLLQFVQSVALRDAKCVPRVSPSSIGACARVCVCDNVNLLTS